MQETLRWTCTLHIQKLWFGRWHASFYDWKVSPQQSKVYRAVPSLYLLLHTRSQLMSSGTRLTSRSYTWWGLHSEYDAERTVDQAGRLWYIQLPHSRGDEIVVLTMFASAKRKPMEFAPQTSKVKEAALDTNPIWSSRVSPALTSGLSFRIFSIDTLDKSQCWWPASSHLREQCSVCEKDQWLCRTY